MGRSSEEKCAVTDTKAEVEDMAEETIYDGIKERLYETIVRRVKPCKWVLDVGCGNCKLVNALAEKAGCRVTGVDIDDSGFAEGLKEAQDSHISDRIDCIKADARSLTSVVTRTYEVAVSVYALHEYEEPLRVLEQVMEVLELGGRMVVVDHLKGSTAEKLWSEEYYTASQVEDMLREAGFGNVKSELLEGRELVLCEGTKTIGANRF